MTPREKPGVSIRGILITFVVVVVFYFGGFHGIEYWRHKNGPWEVEFARTPAGDPLVTIDQAKLGITGVQLIFAGERTDATNLPLRVSFDRPKRPSPFGTIIYEDLTQLPGVVTFNLFGHEIEILPRVLFVNKRQIPWQSGSTLTLFTTNKPPNPPKPPKGG